MQIVEMGYYFGGVIFMLFRGWFCISRSVFLPVRPPLVCGVSEGFCDTDIFNFKGRREGVCALLQILSVGNGMKTCEMK